MKSRIIKGMTLTVITMVLFVTSCQQEDQVSPNLGGKVKIEPISDPRIKAEILAMASGRAMNRGRTTIAPPVQLPAGYDYANAVQVTIGGTNWVTYVAYSYTVNDQFFKEMVGIYYQNGVYKNYIRNRWSLIDHPTAPRIVLKYIYADAAPYYNQAYIIPSTGLVHVSKIYSPSECAKSVGLCVNAFYFNQGWLGIGLLLGSFYTPSIGLGAIGGCMIGCAIYGPHDDCPDYGLC